MPDEARLIPQGKYGLRTEGGDVRVIRFDPNAAVAPRMETAPRPKELLLALDRTGYKLEQVGRTEQQINDRDLRNLMYVNAAMQIVVMTEIESDDLYLPVRFGVKAELKPGADKFGYVLEEIECKDPATPGTGNEPGEDDYKKDRKFRIVQYGSPKAEVILRAITTDEYMARPRFLSIKETLLGSK